VESLRIYREDEDLDRLFRTVSALKSVPACRLRKPELGTPFSTALLVIPPTSKKEKALIKFHGYELNGRRLKVECIATPLVSTVCGSAGKDGPLHAWAKSKKTSDGRVNTLRRVSRAEVDRMSKGQGPKNNSKKGTKSDIPLRLSETEQAELGRAERKGYVSLLSTAYRRGRKNCGSCQRSSTMV
jgi:hypothetical protein